MHLDSNETVSFPKADQRPYIFRPFSRLRGCPVSNRHECVFGGCMCMYTGEYTLFFGWPHSVHSFNIQTHLVYVSCVGHGVYKETVLAQGAPDLAVG